jgi:hypothetical protein
VRAYALFHSEFPLNFTPRTYSSRTCTAFTAPSCSQASFRAFSSWLPSTLPISRIVSPIPPRPRTFTRCVIVFPCPGVFANTPFRQSTLTLPINFKLPLHKAFPRPPVTETVQLSFEEKLVLNLFDHSPTHEVFPFLRDHSRIGELTSILVDSSFKKGLVEIVRPLLLLFHCLPQPTFQMDYITNCEGAGHMNPTVCRLSESTHLMAQIFAERGLPWPKPFNPPMYHVVSLIRCRIRPIWTNIFV